MSSYPPTHDCTPVILTTFFSIVSTQALQVMPCTLSEQTYNFSLVDDRAEPTAGWPSSSSLITLSSFVSLFILKRNLCRSLRENGRIRGSKV